MVLIPRVITAPKTAQAMVLRYTNYPFSYTYDIVVGLMTMIIFIRKVDRGTRRGIGPTVWDIVKASKTMRNPQN
jgi:hypothetical protein